MKPRKTKKHQLPEDILLNDFYKIWDSNNEGVLEKFNETFSPTDVISLLSISKYQTALKATLINIILQNDNDPNKYNLFQAIIGNIPDEKFLQDIVIKVFSLLKGEEMDEQRFNLELQKIPATSAYLEVIYQQIERLAQAESYVVSEGSQSSTPEVTPEIMPAEVIDPSLGQGNLASSFSEQYNPLTTIEVLYKTIALMRGEMNDLKTVNSNLITVNLNLTQENERLKIENENNRGLVDLLIKQTNSLQSLIGSQNQQLQQQPSVNVTSSSSPTMFPQPSPQASNITPVAIQGTKSKVDLEALKQMVGFKDHTIAKRKSPDSSSVDEHKDKQPKKS